MHAFSPIISGSKLKDKLRQQSSAYGAATGPVRFVSSHPSAEAGLHRMVGDVRALAPGIVPNSAAAAAKASKARDAAWFSRPQHPATSLVDDDVAEYSAAHVQSKRVRYFVLLLLLFTYHVGRLLTLSYART
jgi:hypothetical protein